MKSIIYKLLFTCEKVSLLLEKKASAESISFLDNIRLKGHLAICKWCKAYDKKVTIIDDALVRISEKSHESIEEAELKDFKNQLIEKSFK